MKVFVSGYCWARETRDGLVEIGVTPESARLAKQFVYLKLPEKGDKLEKGKPFASLEAIKWAGHLESPIDGTVVEVNTSILEAPEKINQDPLGSWLVRVRPDNPEQLKNLEQKEY